jgi:hypothetical protein
MGGRSRLLAKSLGAILAVALLTPVASAVVARPAHAEPASEEFRFLDLTNQLRRSKGLTPLATNGELTSIARRWSAKMAAAGGIFHNMNLPNDVTLYWQKLGENVGVGSTVEDIQTAFINSPHHYVNLVDPLFNYVGIGVVDSGGRIFVTVDFMAYGSQPAPTASTVAPRTTPVPRTSAAPRAAPVTVAARPETPAPVPTAEPAPVPLAPSPALILALAQLRDADTGK